MFGIGELVQQGRTGSRSTRQSSHNSRRLQDARISGEANSGCHITSLGGRAELANIPTFTKHHVKKIVGGRRRMPESGQSSPQSTKRRTRSPDRPLSSSLGFLRRCLQRQEVRISKTVRYLRDGEYSLQSLLPWYSTPPSLPFLLLNNPTD